MIFGEGTLILTFKQQAIASQNRWRIVCCLLATRNTLEMWETIYVSFYVFIIRLGGLLEYSYKLQHQISNLFILLKKHVNTLVVYSIKIWEVLYLNSDRSTSLTDPGKRKNYCVQEWAFILRKYWLLSIIILKRSKEACLKSLSNVSFYSDISHPYLLVPFLCLFCKLSDMLIESGWRQLAASVTSWKQNGWQGLAL